MKTVSIMQPWATLITLGEKHFETRSWRTKHRGELAIHASQRADKRICAYEPYRSVLENHGYTAKNLPTGAILATCRLTECLQVIGNNGTFAVFGNGGTVDGKEYLFGNFGEGRFAWALSDVRTLPRPIPAKGKLGIWNYEET